MKYNNITRLFLGASLLTLAGCGENTWNDHNLDGFKRPVITDVQTVEYTMTASDISKLVKLKKNIEIAQAAGQLDALAAVGRQGYFTETITPEIYAPAWIDSLSTVKTSKLGNLSDNSTLQLYFPTSQDLPAELTEISKSPEMTVSEIQYQGVWGSETDFVEAFSPSKPASDYIPGLLASEFPNAKSGDYAVVTYNVASQDPVFQGGSQPEEPAFELTSVIGKAQVGDDISIKGVVTGLCTRGYVLTDASGSILVYVSSGFSMDEYAIGDQMSVSATVAAYNGGLQLDGLADSFSAKKEGHQDYSYPTPTVINAAGLEAAAGMFNGGTKSGKPGQYVTLDGTAKVSGKYVNIFVEGTDKFDISAYQAPTSVTSQFKDGAKVKLTGYFLSRSGSSHVNLLVTECNGTPVAKPAVVTSPVSRAGVNIAYVTDKTVYQYSGSAWKSPSNILALTHEDYVSMGQSRDNLNATEAARCLPIYMSTKYPYAKEEETKFIVYNFYNGSTTVSNYVSRAVFVGTEWTVNTINTQMNQFVRTTSPNGRYSWIYDPSIYITLPAGRNNAESQPFYQACVDWVYENVDVPEFGSTSITSGVGYVTTYGNNEYYSGASAYQCNVDLRPTAAKAQCPSVYGSMSDEDIVATLKRHFEQQVAPAALAQLYSDAQPGGNVNQYYVVTFTAYSGSSTVYTARFLVTAPGTFEFTDCTWNEEK